MVKVFSIILFRHFGSSPPVILTSEYNLSSFGYFVRSNVKEVVIFASREVAKHVAPGARGGVTRSQDNQTFNCYYQVFTVPPPAESKKTESANICCCVTTDGDYPKTTAISLVGKAINQFLQSFSFDEWSGVTKDSEMRNNFLAAMLEKYQNPQEADDVEKIKKELVETKEVILESLDLLLKRGERLEDLVERSNDLGVTSKAFMQESSKLNSCCILY